MTLVGCTLRSLHVHCGAAEVRDGGMKVLPIPGVVGLWGRLRFISKAIEYQPF